MRDEVKRCIVWGHFYWGIWSLVMLNDRTLEQAMEFDLPYGVFRLQRFFETFKEYNLGSEEGQDSALMPKMK